MYKRVILLGLKRYRGIIAVPKSHFFKKSASKIYFDSKNK